MLFSSILLRLLVPLCKVSSYLVEKCAWQTVVLIPKGGGDFRSIGLVKLIWKTVTLTLNRRLTASIQFHDKIHRFRTGRVTGTTSLESKLLQCFIAMREEVLY